jgi:NAD(P)-dependent dehydrogenase (short-subunit alcohol dehydrogenase family)
MVLASSLLAGKIALVTGGASGIGRATSRLFAMHGAAVAVVDVSSERGPEVVRQIHAEGGRALFLRCDVSDPVQTESTVETVADQLGGLHILFNNAGITCRRSVVETPVADWDRVVAVNLRGVFLMSKFAIPHLARAGGGAIVNTGSGWGLKGGKDAAVYCATKGAVVNLTRAMALDHAAQGIRVNCICPGDTDTALLAEEGRQLGAEPGAFLREAAARPMQRVGTPEEIAEGVLFLASDQSSFVTGTTLVVDGGGLAG